MKKTDGKWIVPEYYPDFKCKMSDCRHTCCQGWRIPVSFREYSRLIGIPCSRKLRERIDVAFAEPETVSEERYRWISYDWQGRCRLLEDGLCLLCTENWAECLPAICDLYPRSLRQYNEQKVACCSSACERVVEMLAEADSLKMTTAEIDRQPLIHTDVDEQSARKLLDFQKILKDRSTTLVESLEEICLRVNRKQFTDDSQSNADPLQQGLEILGRLTERQSYLYDILEELRERYQNDPQRYSADCQAFQERFTDWMRIFENVINNSLIYENFPFVDSRFDDTDAYKGLCATYGLMRLVCIGHTAIHPDRRALVDAIAALFHLIEHTAFYYNANVVVGNGAVLLKL